MIDKFIDALLLLLEVFGEGYVDAPTTVTEDT